MEIVPIIYNFLIIGGVLLAVVVLVSYLLSKSSQKEEKKPFPQKQMTHQPMYFDHNGAPMQAQPQPVIFPINGNNQREIKVVRKQSYEELDNSNRQQANPPAKNGNRRYTILNEEIKNKNYRYVNEG